MNKLVVVVDVLLLDFDPLVDYCVVETGPLSRFCLVISITEWILGIDSIVINWANFGSL